MYNFDEQIDRHGTGCIKLNGLKDWYGREDLLPMWIADMDFRTPDFITDSLKRRLEHPVFGYTQIPADYFQTISDWVRRLHGWETDPEHIRYIPGIVKGIAMAIDAFLKPGDKVMIQPPVYHPFRIVPAKKGHEVVYCPLLPVYEDGIGRSEDILDEDRERRLVSYTMDFDRMESLFRNDPAISLLILANPHNPVGKCWSREELAELAELAARYGVLVISDEIHAEMALEGHRHIPFASVSPTAASNSITFMAPSKTFNIAGIVSSYTIVPDDRLREHFFGYLDAGELDSPDIFAPIATAAAYREGWEWRREMLDYVGGNIAFTDEWLKSNLPQIRCVRPDASFLVWLDCRLLDTDHNRILDLFVNRAHLAFDDGAKFGSVLPDGTRRGNEGCCFMRMNVGCPRSVVAKALVSLENVVKH